MTVALIVAAGSGERLGADRPKAFVELGGRPLVQWSLDVLRAADGVHALVLALPPGIDGPAGVTSVAGGAVRSDSVRRALAAAGGEDPAEMILVHDAARPLLSGALVQRVLAALEREPGADAAIAALPVTDTVKHADGEGFVAETLDRRSLWAVQTPQVFRRGALERALDVPEEVLAEATDDAWLVERTGGRVLLVRGEEENLKVTTPLDMSLAELLLAARAG
jgi:2-C-methyl-D-erythritol 4-phosphate cytidylyltransferase